MTLSTSEIWEHFSQPLRAFIIRRIDNPDDAEDLLQDIFVKIHTHIPELRDEERLAPWLYQIARNAVADYYRKQPALVELPPDLSEDIEPEEADPEAQIASGLRNMIASLPEKYRQALLLAEIQGLKQRELASRLGISISGAKSRVQRGREMLRQRLLDCCHFEFDRRGRVIDYTPRPDCCRSCRCCSTAAAI